MNWILFLLLALPVDAQTPEPVYKALAASQRVLWIGAHPDDETSSSALLARAVDFGAELYMVSLTAGENSDILWQGLRRGEEVGMARAKLFAESAKILKAQGYEIGPFHNGPTSIEKLPAKPFQGWGAGVAHNTVIAKWDKEGGDPLRYLVELIRRKRPDTIISMGDHCGLSGNIEHLVTAQLLKQAIAEAQKKSAYPQAGTPWEVSNLILNEHVIPALVRCGYCKCSGKKYGGPMYQVPILGRSPRFGKTYNEVKCRVSLNYKNAMKELGQSPARMSQTCEKMTRSAIKRFKRTPTRTMPFFEPYSVRRLPI